MEDPLSSTPLHTVLIFTDVQDLPSHHHYPTPCSATPVLTHTDTHPGLTVATADGGGDGHADGAVILLGCDGGIDRVAGQAAGWAASAAGTVGGSQE